MSTSDPALNGDGPIELRAVGDIHGVSDQHGQEFSLPPADGGRAAWLFLLTCFFVECLVWGFPYSYGVLQEYYSSHEPFVSRPSGIAAIGSTALGIMFIGAPFHFMYMQWWPNHRRKSCFVGIALMGLGLITSSFAQEVWQLILTQGVLYALGGMLVYYPVLLFLDEWFVRRKGMAFGIMWAGSGAGGVLIPFAISWGLSHFGFRTVLRACGIVCCIFLGSMMIFVKPRLPVTLSSTESSRRRFDYRFVRSPAFIALQAGNIFQGLGYFIPGIYLPSYAQNIGMNRVASTATVVLLNTMGVMGSICVGFLTDSLHVTTVLIVFASGSALSVFLLWGLCAGPALLLVFSAAYGFFAVPYTSTYTGMVREIRRQSPGAETGLIFGLLSAGRGIGSVVSGPLSEALMKSVNANSGTTGYESNYENLIIVTGLGVALGGLGFGARRIGWI